MKKNKDYLNNNNEEKIKNLEKKVVKELKERNMSVGELNAVIDQLKNPDLKVSKEKHYWGHRHCKIGLCSDIHIGSNYFDQWILNDIFKRFKKDSVDAVYVAGDITEGYNMRAGHSFECNLHGADAQIKGAIEKIPHITKPIYFITGDHDYSHFKRQGIDVGKHIDEDRKDMHYLGMFNADIMLNKYVKLRLTHPRKGTAYALSYHTQKMIDAFSGGEKPNILGVGHYHKAEYLYYRHINAFQCGCIQRQTNWMKTMNLSAMLGAWIVDVYMNRTGWIDKLEMKMLPYY